MSDLDLPIISPEASPDFRDATGCAEWLQALPLINVGPAHERVLDQLEELNCFALPAGERLRILELIREPVLFVQAEHAKKFTSKPVPLLRTEREIFNNVMALWDALFHGWQHCLQALIDGAPGLSGHAALICQRALWCAGRKINEHYKAYQEIGAEDWRRVHRIYAIAENRGFADQEVSHPEHKGEAETTGTEAYAQVLLQALANPNEHTPRQQMLVARWTERWARKVTISTDPPAESGVAPLSVDLESDTGASHDRKQGPAVRYLHVDEVGRIAMKRVQMLRSGETPEALGLGTDVPAGLAGQMLITLYHQWCEHKSARLQSRRAGTRTAQMCSGIAAIHFYVTGLAFRQPGEAKELTQKQRQEIAVFGRLSARDEEDYATAQVAALENWTIHDESISGVRLERPEAGGRNRFVHQQLVAVRSAEAKVFALGVVRWLSVSENYELKLGTRILAGVPRGIAVRLTGINVFNEKYVPAILLPALPALQSPATLIMPPGYYRSRRVVEVYADRPEKFQLSSLLERGSDYERCTFEPA